MTKAGERILASIEEARRFARGEDVPGVRVHIPDEIDTRRIRKNLGLTQSAFCETYGFELATLRDWEQGRRMPNGAARTLLRVIDENAPAVAAAITGGRVRSEAGKVQVSGATRAATAAAVGLLRGKGFIVTVAEPIKAKFSGAAAGQGARVARKARKTRGDKAHA